MQKQKKGVIDMNEVIQKAKITEEGHLLRLRAPETACRAKPGQYLLLKTNPNYPALPFLIAGVERDSVLLTVPAKGEQGKRLEGIRKGKKVFVTGPLGKHIVPGQYGNIAIVCDGLSVMAGCWIAKSLKGGDNKIFLVTTSKGKINKQLGKQLNDCADKIFVVPEGTSKMGDPLVGEVHNLLRRKHINLTFTMVDLFHSHQLARITHLRSKTFSFLTPILDDGLGICSHCRVLYDGETRLACIEGPAMDAHKIDWETLLVRHGFSNLLSREA